MVFYDNERDGEMNQDKYVVMWCVGMRAGSDAMLV